MIDAFICSDSVLSKLPTFGAEVQGMGDKDEFAPMSIIYVADKDAYTKIYIADENGEIVARIILPCYVKFDSIVKSYETCDYDNAEAVFVNVDNEGEQESFYADLAEKSIRHQGFKVATIIKE